MLSNYSLEIMDNTEDEILETTKEMMLRMEGSWYDTELSEALHEKFWSEMTYYLDEEIIKTRPRCKYQARYCMADLLNNSELLEESMENVPACSEDPKVGVNICETINEIA